MFTSKISPLSQTLNFAMLGQLQGLLQEMVRTVGAEVFVITEEFLAAANNGADGAQFTVVASAPFSALLWSKAMVSPGKVPGKSPGKAHASLDEPADALYQIHLTFEPEAIATFLEHLGDQPHETFQASSHADSILVEARSVVRPNDPALQSHFTLELIRVLTHPATGGASTASSSDPSGEALRQQFEQEQLFNQVITQIRQSLELPTILEAAVEQIRNFLQVDRLVIYQLEPPPLPIPLPEKELEFSNCTRISGHVTYESRASDTIPSLLNLSEEYCLTRDLLCLEKYRQGCTIAVDDAETCYADQSCLLELLRRSQVRAKLVAPIVVQKKLWGLLIAHHCHSPYAWSDSEQLFLQQIAEHLAIAIRQAQLYAQVRQQKQTLEQRVIERTQELHDAMRSAQAASRAKSEFLAAMSHELRTPLTCIIGMSTTLMRWSGSELGHRQQSFLRTIHDSGEHLLELINDILDLSQVEAGKVMLSLSEFSLSRLARQSLKAMEEKARYSNVELEFDLQIEPERDRFIADPRRMQQILINLLSNAIKFTPEGGRVVLRLFADQNLAIFQIKDTGIGIPEHQRSLLFQKFQQLDASYHRKYEGTGLGLALTKQLVELHRGWIDVDSTVGVGSVFTVRLPRQNVSAVAEVVAPQVPVLSTYPIGRIVLLENDEESAHLICDMLTAAGYQVVWVLDGATAIHQVEILHPLAIIVAMQSPEINGYEIIKNLRQTPSTKMLKILALTSSPTSKEQQRYLSAGADHCLLKPLQPDILLDQVLALTLEA